LKVSNSSSKSSKKLVEESFETSSDEETTDIFERIEDKLGLKEMPFIRKS
jgi:hypothetical protein